MILFYSRTLLFVLLVSFLACSLRFDDSGCDKFIDDLTHFRVHHHGVGLGGVFLHLLEVQLYLGVGHDALDLGIAHGVASAFFVVLLAHAVLDGHLDFPAAFDGFLVVAVECEHLVLTVERFVELLHLELAQALLVLGFDLVGVQFKTLLQLDQCRGLLQ